MMSLKGTILLLGFALAVSQAPQTVAAQGKGEGKGQGRGQSQGKEQDKEKAKGKGKSQGEGRGRGEKQTGEGRGRSDKSEVARARDKSVEKIHSVAGEGKGKGGRHKFTRLASTATMPQSVRHFATSRRPKDLIMAAAVSHAFARGRRDDFRISEAGNEILLTNLNGDRLVFLDDDHARDLGRWRVGVIDDNPREGGPSFCRSGAGHPVWGREWCLDKGFGLGSNEDFRWGRTTDPGDIVFREFSPGGSLIGNALASVLGTNAFNRLALHAVTLGLVEPLVGRWVSQNTGPQLLFVNSGQTPVAELVDVNRDNRADNMLVALRPWYY